MGNRHSRERDSDGRTTTIAESRPRLDQVSPGRGPDRTSPDRLIDAGASRHREPAHRPLRRRQADALGTGRADRPRGCDHLRRGQDLHGSRTEVREAPNTSTSKPRLQDPTTATLGPSLRQRLQSGEVASRIADRLVVPAHVRDSEGVRVDGLLGHLLGRSSRCRAVLRQGVWREDLGCATSVFFRCSFPVLPR